MARVGKARQGAGAKEKKRRAKRGTGTTGRPSMPPARREGTRGGRAPCTRDGRHEHGERPRPPTPKPHPHGIKNNARRGHSTKEARKKAQSKKQDRSSSSSGAGPGRPSPPPMPPRALESPPHTSLAFLHSASKGVSRAKEGGSHTPSTCGGGPLRPVAATGPACSYPYFLLASFPDEVKSS